MMHENNYNKFLINSQKYMVLLLYIALIYFLFPIVLGLLLAYIVFPLFQFIHRQFKVPFFLVVIIISSVLFSLFGVFTYFVIQSIIQLFPTVQATLQRFSENEFDHVIFPYLVEKLTAMIQEVTLFLVSLIKNSLQSLFDFFLVAMAFYFSIFESKKNRLWFFTYVPKAYRSEWSRYFTKVMSLISYFIFVELQLFTLTFLLLSAGFFFLSFDAPILKAFVIALADALPFLGIGIFLIPLAVYFFIINQNILALAILVLYIFILISRQLVESMLWSHTLHIRMIHTFLISAASILLFGFYGILLSPVLLMVAMKVKQSTIFAR
jgi:predicted PurR-regulated permease PerM